MTTTVKIEAHCGTDTEVQIDLVTTSPDDFERTTIQDGEAHEVHVYDDREVTVREVKKE